MPDAKHGAGTLAQERNDLRLTPPRFGVRSIAVLRPGLFASLLFAASVAQAQFTDSQFDPEALPTVPDGFRATLFAREPLVRQPCSMAFDARGRLFVGMGPQYRSPTPETAGDVVVVVHDRDGDGVAESTTVFASGFNAVQGLAWHGRDLWVANAPDLTVVRDLDGDDEADEYVRIYTDLGNLEHGLHGLNWAPDGKLYMSKGNSKGLTQPGRIAPRPFRDLWGVQAPADAPDFPEPQTFRKGEYQHNYHDPADDWGLEGGVLRCDAGGRNLEIVARGFRNPWDIAFDSGFNWLGTDNDQTMGDRVFMPFFGAHFGWNHPWSTHWTDAPHLPTAPVSGPLFEGSGTGVTFCDSPQFPESHRGVFLINDWLRKTTFLWRPRRDGALLRPADGDWQPFVRGGKSLYRPTDLEVGPDGALWILGWSSGYGAEWKEGELTNEGRIFRIESTDAPRVEWRAARRNRPLQLWTTQELIDDFRGPLPVWRTDAQAELIRRGESVRDDLMQQLSRGISSESPETWTAWTLAQCSPKDRSIDQFFAQILDVREKSSFNLRLQSVRILAHRIRESGVARPIHPSVVARLADQDPRLRFAAVQSLMLAHQSAAWPDLCRMLDHETDPAVFYAGWKALLELVDSMEIRGLLQDPRPGVRLAALLALMEAGLATPDEVAQQIDDRDPRTRDVAELWQRKRAEGGEKATIRGRALATASDSNTALPRGADSVGAAPIRKISTRGKGLYRTQVGGLLPGTPSYTDRQYTLIDVPQTLAGCDFIQTANADDGSHGDAWLSFEALVPLKVHVAIDTRQRRPPLWIDRSFSASSETLKTSDCQFRLYSRDYPTGRVELGGNTDDGSAGGKSNYLVILEPLPIAPPAAPASLEEVLGKLNGASVARGEYLFHNPRGAGCFKCHRLDDARNGFGPNLGDVGSRATARHIAQSLVEPNAVITEGYALQLVATDDGKVHAGVLLEESGLLVTLGLSTGERLAIPRGRIESRKSAETSSMPAVAPLLPAEHLADLTAFLMERKGTPVSRSALKRKAPDSPTALEFKRHPDRLSITSEGRPVGDFVFRDKTILRPYFANLHAPGGMRVTRNHPPVEGRDATDHDTMHPGLWLGLGDLNGVDFWRNRGRIEHRRLNPEPSFQDGRLRFGSESQLLTPDGRPLCDLRCQFTITRGTQGWLVVWDSEFQSNDGDIVFGDQEEMGFGARVATPLTEKNGGLLTSSQGKTSAAATWGQPAAWCDYSGEIDGQRGGITLMGASDNFRECWWHNRDYGVFVANPFGREAMRQGPRSAVTVKRGDRFRLTFGAVLHDSPDYDPAAAFVEFSEIATGEERAASRDKAKKRDGASASDD